MTVGDYPEYLAVGYLINQSIIKDLDKVEDIEVVEEINTVVVRTKEKSSYEINKKNQIKTSGCANGTIFNNVIEEIKKITLNSSIKINTSEVYSLYKKISLTPSLYLKSGAIHGCVLCCNGTTLAYFEDVGRHNAIDKLAGYMFLNNINPEDKVLYTTGRLTSEMVIKTVMMKIPILASRSGYTAWGVELAKSSNLTMLGRLRGRKFVVLSGYERISFSD